MSKTPSLIPHVPLLSHSTHQSTLLPDPSKILSETTKLIPDPSKILSDPTKLIPDASKILSDPTKLIPDPSKILSDTNKVLTDPFKILSDPTKLIPDPSKILSETTKLLTDPSKILSETTRLLTDPSKVLPRNLLPEPSKILANLLSDLPKVLSANNLLTGPSNILSTFLSSATKNPLTSILGQVLNIATKLLGLFNFLSSFPLRRFLIVGTLLLILVGLIVAGGSALGLIIFSPLIIVLSPIWVPASTALFVVTAGFLFECGFAAVLVLVGAWLVRRFFNGHNSHGSDQMLSNNTKDATSST